MSDPFEAPYWNLLQILAWVYLGDRSLVRSVADEPRDRGRIEVWERTAEGEERVLVRRPAPSFMELSVAGHGEDSRHYPSLKKAKEALSVELQNGNLTFLGRRGGRGELEVIPAKQWSDLWFYDDPVLVASKSYPRRGAVRWDKVRGRREEVLAIWPDKLAEELTATATDDINQRARQEETADTAPKGRRPRKTTIEDEAKIESNIKTVLGAAVRKWRNTEKAPEFRQMARLLVEQEPEVRKLYKEETVRKILEGTYNVSKRRGIPGYVGYSGY